MKEIYLEEREEHASYEGTFLKREATLTIKKAVTLNKVTAFDCF